MKAKDTSPIDDYFKKFGENQKAMAASLQSLIYCEKFIDSSGATTILDAGSGVSSVFFHSKYNNVLTVDDNAQWASITKEFILEKMNVAIKINPITSIKNKSFDFVFYDYGNMETRIYFFKQALGMCKIALYVDDMHVIFYREYIQARCREYNLRYLPETVDEFGRFGALIMK